MGELNPGLLAEGIRSLRGPLDLEATARRAAVIAVETVPGVLHAYVRWRSSADDRTVTGVASSDGSAAGFARVERELVEGPSELAAETRLPVHSASVSDDARWPELSAAVAPEVADAAAIALPLVVNDRLRGVLTCLGRDFGEATLRAADTISAAVGVALDAAHAELTLSRAIETRGVIGQAQGILMERFGLDDERAFSVLKRVSQHRNVKLNLIAAETVATRTTPGRLTFDEAGDLLAGDDRPPAGS